MERNYESITTAAVEAISAIADAPMNSKVFFDDSAKTVACCVFFSWTDYVGGAARPIDVDRMLDLIREID